MGTKIIKGLSQIQSKYDAFFIDLWGVIHNGVEVYPEAIKVLENLNKLNKRFVLISNAPRPSKSVERYLINLKMCGPAHLAGDHTRDFQKILNIF